MGTGLLGDVGNRKLEKYFFLVYSSLLGLGPADGSCCGSQKLHPGTMNSGGICRSQMKKVEEESWILLSGRRLVSKVSVRKRRGSPLGSKTKTTNKKIMQG